ncbi:hypothetical protein ABZP36_033469 [Zizania latifolia]
MPCLAQESISSLIRETYSHCHVPCVRIPAAGWSSGYDTDDDSFLDDALDSKQVILNEMRNRQMKKRSRCSVDSPTPSSPFVWSSFTPLDPRSVLEKVPIPKKCVMEEQEIKKEKGKDCGDDDGGDADDESEAFFSVKSFFSRSTSRGATVASSLAMDLAPPLQSPATWEGFRDCEGWPFGLCRRPAIPPLPSTPADSWKWRNRSRSRSRSNLAASPARAHSYKITSSS